MMVQEPAREIPLLASCDVLVAGGGPGGLFAALAAARSGARVMLAERLGFLGGNAASGLPLLGFLDRQAEPLVGGIPLEFVERLARRGGAVGPLPCPKHVSFVAVEPEAVKRVADEMCCETGVEVLLEAWAAAPIVEGGRVRGAALETKEGRRAVRAEVVVDATGDADVAVMAGAEMLKGRPGDGALQPASLVFELEGVDTERMLAYLEAHPEEVNPIGRPKAAPFPMAYFRSVPRYIVAGLEPAAQRARAQNDFPADLRMVVINMLPRAGHVSINGAKVLHCDATDGRQRAAATVEARAKAWALTQFLRKYIPGFERCELTGSAATLGVRETRRIVGEYLLTQDDVLGGARFADAICRGEYPIDIHSLDGTRSTFILLDRPYDVPYRCLVPRGVDGLLVAGRPISVSYEAYGSTRAMGACMAIGQAAGTAAALAVRNGVTPRRVNTEQLRATLAAHGAILE